LKVLHEYLELIQAAVARVAHSKNASTFTFYGRVVDGSWQTVLKNFPFIRYNSQAFKTIAKRNSKDLSKYSRWKQKLRHLAVGLGEQSLYETMKKKFLHHRIPEGRAIESKVTTIYGLIRKEFDLLTLWKFFMIWGV
jgi:hypothetical protein